MVHPQETAPMSEAMAQALKAYKTAQAGLIQGYAKEADKPFFSKLGTLFGKDPLDDLKAREASAFKALGEFSQADAMPATVPDVRTHHLTQTR